MEISRKDGKELIFLARCAIFKRMEHFNFEKIVNKFSEKKGVFVTLHSIAKHQNHEGHEGEQKRELRGCIGFVEPIYSLGEAVVKAARSAAFEDPRFPSVRAEEEGEIVVDISILSELQEIKASKSAGTSKMVNGSIEDIVKSISKNIKIGKDGIAIKYGPYFGLLLPVVAVEHKFDAERFLIEACYKAGLSLEVLKNLGCKVYKFQCLVFSEEEPGGEVTCTS